MAEDKKKSMIAESFRELMEYKPFHKITISDIANGCNISRTTFYYHFEDIYDLLRWTVESDVHASLKSFSEEKRWQKGLSLFLDNLKEQKQILLNAVHSLGRNEIANLFDKEIESLILMYIRAGINNRPIADEDLTFITRFYKYAFEGMIFDWIDNEMKEDAAVLERNLEILMQNNIDDDIEGFVNARKISK